MELYLDVDGVILDFESSFIDFIRDEYINDLPLNYTLRSWEMAEEFRDLDIVEVWERFVENDRFTNLALLVDPESFNDLSRRHPVFFVTNIANAQYRARQVNLERHKLNYSGLYLAGHFNFGDETYPSKSEIIRKIHRPGERIVFLDDHPKNCEDIRDSIPKSDVFLMDRPHNREVPDQSWTRVSDFTDFITRL